MVNRGVPVNTLLPCTANYNTGLICLDGWGVSGYPFLAWVGMWGNFVGVGMRVNFFVGSLLCMYFFLSLSGREFYMHFVVTPFRVLDFSALRAEVPLSQFNKKIFDVDTRISQHFVKFG